jgi:hypothetical protein
VGQEVLGQDVSAPIFPMLPVVWDHLLVPVGAVVDLGDVLAEAALTRDHQVVEGHAKLPVPRVLYTTPK